MKKLDKKIRRIDTDRDKLRIKQKDSDSLKVEENVFDEPTLKNLYKLSRKNIIKEMGGAISTGKEANVFYALGPESELAVKIYRITTSTFKAMEAYITKDPRFQNIRHTKRDIVFAWTKKESQNLKRARNAGVRAPEPLGSEKNILIMEFLGEKEVPYPQLKNIALDREDAKRIFEKIVDYMQLLFTEANLIHADLSEYNIIIDPNNLEPIIIDMGQAVTQEHPNAREFLYRDVQNILRYFSRYGLKMSPEELLSKIQAK